MSEDLQPAKRPRRDKADYETVSPSVKPGTPMTDRVTIKLKREATLTMVSDATGTRFLLDGVAIGVDPELPLSQALAHLGDIIKCDVPGIAGQLLRKSVESTPVAVTDGAEAVDPAHLAIGPDTVLAHFASRVARANGLATAMKAELAASGVTFQHASFGDSNGVTVELMRTLRLPDDGKAHDLPAELGSFPIERVSDHEERVPSEWVRRGGFMVPMYQREAMWLLFNHSTGLTDAAVRVAVGGRNALTGREWRCAAAAGEQDYLVIPQQRWLDGVKVSEREVRQFVATPLGRGMTVEGQLTGQERVGGLQLRVAPPVFNDASFIRGPDGVGTDEGMVRMVARIWHTCKS